MLQLVGVQIILIKIITKSTLPLCCWTNANESVRERERETEKNYPSLTRIYAAQIQIEIRLNSTTTLLSTHLPNGNNFSSSISSLRMQSYTLSTISTVRHMLLLWNICNSCSCSISLTLASSLFHSFSISCSFCCLQTLRIIVSHINTNCNVIKHLNVITTHTRMI